MAWGIQICKLRVIYDKEVCCPLSNLMPKLICYIVVVFVTATRFDIQSLNISGEEDEKGIVGASAFCKLLSCKNVMTL